MRIGEINMFNQDCLDGMKSLYDGSIDVICIDPPYLYLKGQKLERPFDEHLFFSECKRLLTDKGFIVTFGRGTSFYRWNTILADLGFKFKEEIVWNKRYTSSPLMPLSRIHETISIHAKKAGKVNKNKIPYLEMRSNDIPSIKADINRLKSLFVNKTALDSVLRWIRDKELTYEGDYVDSTTITKGKRRIDRCVAMMATIENGLNEKSVIEATRDHYTAIHPTQKPVRLLERLLALVVPKDKPRNEIVVADFFAGSMSCMEAVYNMGMKGVAYEIDQEYFEAGYKRLEALQPKQAELF